MSLIDIKNQIKNNIEQVKTLDITKLYPDNPNIQSWNDWGNDELKNYVDSIIDVLKILLDNLGKIDSSGLNNAQNLNNHLNGLISEYNNQLSSLSVDQITNQHHAPLNQLEGINNILRSSGLYTDLVVEKLLENKIGNLNEVKNISSKILPKKKALDDAIISAEKWLKSKKDLDNKFIEDHAKAFFDRAQEHRTLKQNNFTYAQCKNKKWLAKNLCVIYKKYLLRDIAGSWIWLGGALVFAGITGWITYSFIELIKEAGKTVQIGESLLRIASLSIPAYLTLFCANQFLYHKKMYNNYMFKFASLNTMTNLISTQQDDMSNKILERGLNVIFSEPKIKESGKYDSHLVNELIGMLKSQLNK